MTLPRDSFYSGHSCIPQTLIDLVVPIQQTDSTHGMLTAMLFTGTADAVRAAVHRNLL